MKNENRHQTKKNKTTHHTDKNNNRYKIKMKMTLAYQCE